MEVKYNKDGSIAKKRGRPAGSKNTPKTAVQILTSTKNKPSKAPKTRAKRGSKITSSSPLPQPTYVEPLPSIETDAKFWRERYFSLEKEIRRLLDFIGHEAVRENVEPEYNLRIWLNPKYKEMKFSNPDKAKPKKGIMIDPFTQIWHYLDNEDVYLRNNH